MAHAREATKALVHRLLTGARARCSYVGCTRLRHTGPCNEMTDVPRTHRDETH